MVDQKEKVGEKEKEKADPQEGHAIQETELQEDVSIRLDPQEEEECLQEEHDTPPHQGHQGAQDYLQEEGGTPHDPHHDHQVAQGGPHRCIQEPLHQKEARKVAGQRETNQAKPEQDPQPETSLQQEHPQVADLRNDHAKPLWQALVTKVQDVTGGIQPCAGTSKQVHAPKANNAPSDTQKEPHKQPLVSHQRGRNHQENLLQCWCQSPTLPKPC